MTDNHIEQDAAMNLDDELCMSKKHEPKQDISEDESPAPADAPPALPAEAEISAEEKLKVELDQAKDRFLRLAAEFDNFKKISKREQLNSLKFANESLISSLLPIIDNLEQAVIAGKIADESKTSVLIGVEMVLKQLIDALQKFGVEMFSAKGQAFDPARHEAVSEQEDDSVREGTVVIEYQKGYLLNGRLLRPARVVVAKKSGT